MAVSLRASRVVFWAVPNSPTIAARDLSREFELPGSALASCFPRRATPPLFPLRLRGQTTASRCLHGNGSRQTAHRLEENRKEMEKVIALLWSWRRRHLQGAAALLPPACMYAGAQSIGPPPKTTARLHAGAKSELAVLGCFAYLGFGPRQLEIATLMVMMTLKTIMTMMVAMAVVGMMFFW